MKTWRTPTMLWGGVRGSGLGFVYVDVTVHGTRGSKIIRMLVDTGSTYIVLSPTIIRELGLHKTPYSVEVTLADKRRVKASLYLAEVEVRGRRGPALVAELETPTPLLGVYALETLGFKVNPRTGELEEISPEGGYLLATA
ncbi:MAG: retroviral-like aspartic protease family protein, partial [Desulfurococcales archaeon]|nr:retroviral-like aspartic protease family protein [Desulfurococcales archaeon]